MTWTSHPHRIEDPRAVAWSDDGAEVAVAGANRIEVIELATPGSRRIDARFDDIASVELAGGELVVVDGDRRHRFGRDGERSSEPHAARPLAIPGEGDDAIIALATSAEGARLVTTAAGVSLIRGGERRWIARRGAIGFAGERPIVGSQIFGRGGDPRRTLMAGGAPISAGAIAAGPGERIAFACVDVVHVAAAGDLSGVDPLPGLVEAAVDLAVSGDHLAAASSREIAVFDRRSGAVVGRWDHGGGGSTRIAFLDPETLLIGRDSVELWRWRSRRRIDRWIPGDRDVELVRRARDRVLAAGHNWLALLSDTGEVIWRHDIDGWVRGADLHPTEPRIAVVVADQPVAIFSDDGAELGQLPMAQHLAFTASRIVCSDYQAARAFGWPDPGEPPSLESFDRAARIDDGLLVAGDGAVTRYADDGSVIWSQPYRDGVESVAGVAHDEVFYTGGRTSWIAERRIADGSLSRVLAAGSGRAISALAASADGHHLVAGDDDGRIAIWEIGERCRRVGFADASNLSVSERFETGSFGRIGAVAFGTELVAVGRAVLRWKGPLIGDIGTRDPDSRELDADCLSGNGEVVAVTAWDQPIEVRAVRSGEVLSRIPAPDENYGVTLALDDGGDRLAVVDKHTATVWSTDRGELIGRVDVDREIGGVAFASGRDLVLWVSRYETASGRPGLAVRWSPDTSELERWIEAPVDVGFASGLCAAGRRALLWSNTLAYAVEDRELVAVLPPHPARVTAAALSASGVAALGDAAGMIRVWDRDRRLIAELCSTTDGSWWRRDPDFFWEPSPNLAEGRW